MWSGVSYKQGTLPKLKIAQEMARRDSLSSSMTGDSGYNSDPEISLSPLDIVSSEQGELHLQWAEGEWSLMCIAVPYTSATFTIDSSALFDVKEAISSKAKRVTANKCNPILFRKPQDNRREIGPPKIDVTSVPTTLENVPEQSKLDWSNAFKKPAPPANSTSDVEQWISTNLQPHQPKERNSSIISLSSTGSCDMYSNTDDNSEDEEVVGSTPSTLSKATLKTIELIMRKIELNLAYAAFMQCAGGQSARAQGSTGSTSRAGRGGSQGSGGKRKSRVEDSLPPDDPDEDGSNKRRRISITTTTEDSESGPRFACPFYKHDQNRYRNRRTCPGPGWLTVHRMKEHLYRSHAQPIYCNRCYLMFDSDKDLSSHQRADPCPVSAPQPIDGIGRETLTIMRKRSPAYRLEEEKWRDTYQLLFPDVSTADIPSPCKYVRTTALMVTDKSVDYDSASPNEGSRRFRRELLERIRQELFATAEREPGPVEQRLLRQVSGIIQRCENELLSTSNTAPVNVTPGLLHPSMPTYRRASAPSILEEPTPSYAQPELLPPPLTNVPNYTPAIPTPIQPSQSGPMSPQATPGFNEVPQLAGDVPPLPGGPYHTYPEPLPFTSNDWLDWDLLFPPGPEVQLGDRTETHPTLVSPVWT